MSENAWARSDIDTRSRYFVGMTVASLAERTGGWPRPASAPEDVQALLAKSRRLFVGAATCYDNLVQASLVSLQAAERALKHLLTKPVTARVGLGQLLREPAATSVLTERQFEWYSEFALHFRNQLAHPTGPMAFTPPIAEGIVVGVHVVMAELFDIKH